MKLFRGFKGKYFSLIAILACSAGVKLEANNVSLEANDYSVRQNLASEKESETEEEVTSSAIRVIGVINSKKSQEQSSLKTLKQTSHTADSTQIITSEEISIKGFQSLAEAISSIAGISYTSNGGAGQSTSVYLRGMNAAHTLVLIDGVRVNDVSGLSGAQIELIDLYNIDRIEVVKGSQSGIWGSDASAGVINIITKQKTDGFGIGVMSEFGSNSWQKYAISPSYSNEIFDISSTISFLKTKGISAAAPKKGESGYGDRDFERDGFENRLFHIKSGINLTNSDRLEFFIRESRAEEHFDGGAGLDAKDYDDLYGFGTSEYFNVIKTALYSAGYIGSYGKHKINLKANYSGFRRSFYGGYIGKTYELYVLDEFNYFDDSFLLVGAGYLRDKVSLSAGSILPNDKQDNRYIFATNSNSFGSIVLSQSARFDIRDTFENKFTFKLGAKYYLYKDFFIASLYKTGFLAPNLYQQNYGTTKDLKAEESGGYEVSLGSKNFLVTYFDQRVKNAIEYSGAWPNDFYINIDGKSRFRGVEISANYQLFDFLGEISYTYLDAKDTNNNRIARRAQNKIDASLIWFSPYDVSVNLKGSYVGSRYDSIYLQAPQTGRYFLADLIVNYDILEHINLYLKAHNIFDKYYQEVDGYGTYGRSFYIGMNGNF